MAGDALVTTATDLVLDDAVDAYVENGALNSGVQWRVTLRH